MCEVTVMLLFRYKNMRWFWRADVWNRRQISDFEKYAVHTCVISPEGAVYEKTI